ncbi:MAG: RHS repeat-associated core domain-containing protein [Terrimicrobiaceae bacterium]|nr:RHS repeat-associated core domain-containing protein [Terrimicrobiaceae bacterium]
MKYHTATASSGYASPTSPASTETTAYDGMGNLTSADGWTLGYSPLGQLVSASKTGAPTQTYGFDAFGNRAYEESNGNYSRKLLYVGRQPFDSYETPSGGGTATTKSYVYGPGIDHPICEVTGNAGVIKYQLQDANGNVVALISAAGAVTERYTYDAWGKLTVYDASWAVQSSAPQSRFLFTGRDYDAETGLYHYRTRAYSPKIGRFLQPDTIDFSEEDLNIYRYVFNNPINAVDPQGLLDVQWYGNYEGPGWTNGGYENQQFPDRNPKPSQIGRDKNGKEVKPIDPTDSAFKDHDTCYAQCKNPDTGCPKTGGDLKKCERNCDDALQKGLDKARRPGMGPNEFLGNVGADFVFNFTNR